MSTALVSLEKTLVMLKPDITERGLIDTIKGIYILNGFNIEFEELYQFNIETAGRFYSEHLGKDFFDSLCAYMSSAPVYVMILSGENAIERVRELNGKTNPIEAKIGTIRRHYGISQRFNSVHASANLFDATREIDFFKK